VTCSAAAGLSSISRAWPCAYGCGAEDGEAPELQPARRARWLLIVAIVIVLAALSTVASVVVSK
jgi:hypothetical protein